MAKPNNRRPWIVEFQAHALTAWFEMDAFRDEDEAQMQAALMRKRAPTAEFRVRDYRMAAKPGATL